MKHKKILQELTIKNNFMFGAVMCDENNCRRLLEMILRFPIDRVEISKEKTIVYHPEYKGVRLDIYAKDANNTRYNVEMQSVQQNMLGKRTRYYHSQIDMELLQTGEEYLRLPNTYVIFICDFDPFGEGRYVYTFENSCQESGRLKLQDGSKSIFLSTCGRNRDDVPEGLVNFLEYVKASPEESTRDFGDPYVQILQKSVQSVKENREWEERFMILREMLREERAEGRAEGRAEAVVELLTDLGAVSNALLEKIRNESNPELLIKWLKLAARAHSVEQFEENM